MSSPPTNQLMIPSTRGLDRDRARALIGSAALVVALGGVFWALTGSLALVAGVMAFYVVLGSLYLFGAWGSTRWLARVCATAARALEAGRVAEARVLLDDNLSRSAANTPMYAIAIWLRARVAVREGEFAAARERLEMLLGWHWYSSRGPLHAHAAQVRAQLVLCLALEGRLDEAERERARAEPARSARLDRDSELEARARELAARTHARTWLLADGVLLARRERFTELLDRVDQRVSLLVELPRSDRQSLALLRAWARFRVLRDQLEFRAAHAGLDTPEPLRQSGFERERVAYLTRAWPELREFMISISSFD